NSFFGIGQTSYPTWVFGRHFKLKNRAAPAATSPHHWSTDRNLRWAKVQVRRRLEQHAAALQPWACCGSEGMVRGASTTSEGVGDVHGTREPICHAAPRRARIRRGWLHNGASRVANRFETASGCRGA